MSATDEPSRNNAFLSVEQIQALEHIARDNHTFPAHLVSLAVDALIVEAARNEGWLPIPEIPAVGRFPFPRG